MDGFNLLISTLIEKGVPFSVDNKEYVPNAIEDDFDYARVMHEEHQIDILINS